MNAPRAHLGLSFRTRRSSALPGRTALRGVLSATTLTALLLASVSLYAGDGPRPPRRAPVAAPSATGAAPSAGSPVGATPAAGATPTAPSTPAGASSVNDGAVAGEPTAAAPAPEASGGAVPGAAADPHGMGVAPPFVTGSPFASQAHRHQAELLRANRSTVPQSQNMPGDGVPPGTLGMLIRDGERGPVAGAKVKLLITHESIAHGNTDTVRETVSDEQGRAGFTGLNTDSSYKYEAVVEQGGSRYSTGAIKLRRESGQIAVLYVFPTTDKLDDTFVITRMLYALQPREDIFQVDTVLRIQNGSTKTWSPKDFYLQLPDDAQAFRPPRSEGDLRGVAEGNRVHITGSFTPGSHELSFGFQIPNPRTPNIHLPLQTVPNLTDARVFLEATDTMGLQVEGMRPAERTTGQEGQNALMAAADFLGNETPAPATLQVNVTGMPPRGQGNIVASIIAALVAMLGVAFAVSRPDKDTTSLTNEDRSRAKTLLLDELVSLEKAFRGKEIGPKTYEQARRTLLDSMARLDAG